MRPFTNRYLDPAKFLILGMFLLLLSPAGALAASLEQFFGSFEGSVVLDEAVDGVVSEDARKTLVEIAESDDGFKLDWTTIITKSSGKTKSVNYSIQFLPTEAGGTYSSAMRKNMFGKWIPLNPLKGEPYVWARLEGETLSVYALIIREDGGYEMQQYDRTLLPNGNLDLVFTRVKDGKPLKTIRGVLARK